MLFWWMVRRLIGVTKFTIKDCLFGYIEFHSLPNNLVKLLEISQDIYGIIFTIWNILKRPRNNFWLWRRVELEKKEKWTRNFSVKLFFFYRSSTRNQHYKPINQSTSIYWSIKYSIRTFKTFNNTILRYFHPDILLDYRKKKFFGFLSRNKKKKQQKNLDFN